MKNYDINWQNPFLWLVLTTKGKHLSCFHTQQWVENKTLKTKTLLFFNKIYRKKISCSLFCKKALFSPSKHYASLEIKLLLNYYWTVARSKWHTLERVLAWSQVIELAWWVRFISQSWILTVLIPSAFSDPLFSASEEGAATTKSCR